MASDLFLRPATPDDIPAMVSVLFSAWSSSILNELCFPASSPEVHTYWAQRIASNMAAPNTYLIVAMLPSAGDSSPTLAGWARWVRKPSPAELPEPLKFTPKDYPSTGDGAVAANFFQGNYDATRRLVGKEEHWFLGTLVTGREYQKKGVGSALMKYGVDRADREGWMVYLNASEDGKRLYEKFGFHELDKTEFEMLGMTQYHMKRDANKR
ncbi:Fc.00g014050.m01.CDS01 [Cosmosporella sp. VM-42]